MWRSIDETEETVVLRGTLATTPESYERFRRRRRITFGGAALFFHRVIAWSIAASAHLLLAALLLSLYLETKKDPDSTLFARLYRGNSSDQDVPLPGPKFEEAKKEEPEPEPPKPEPPKPAPVVEAPKPAPVATPEPPTPQPNPVAAAPAVDAKPAVVGTGATAAGAGAPKPSVGDKEIESDPTEALRKRRAGELGKLRGGSDREILVVAGCYDRVQDVLERLDIPHRVIQPENLARQDLSKCKALLVNCHNQYSGGGLRPADRAALEKEVVELESKIRELRQRAAKTTDKMALYRINLDLLRATSAFEEGQRRLQASADTATLSKNLSEFVAGGGYLFTSDWGLTILERAVPGYLRTGGVVGPRTVAIRPKPGCERHPLLEEVFLEPSKGSTRTARRFDWDIDSSSYSIRIDKTEAVEVLVESADPLKYPAVAVTFRHERGRSLHVLSHFQKQATRHGDYALQNMLVNFLIERWEGRVPSPAPPAAVEPARPASPPPPAFDAFRAHTDESWGVALAVPRGWSVRNEGSTLMLLPDNEGAARGVLSRASPDPSLADGTAGWDEVQKGAKKAFERDHPAAKTTRRAQAFCSGCPALLSSWSLGERGAVQFVVAAPKATFVLTWTAPAAEFAALEPLFEKASRAFTVLRK